MLVGAFDNLLINGDFLPGLWSHLRRPEEGVECATWRQTFAADRWKIRYAHPQGAPVTQHLCVDAPDAAGHSSCLEIRGADGVSQPVLLGQRIEAADASRYRRLLSFSAWVHLVNTQADPVALSLVLGSATQPDMFGNVFNDGVDTELIERFESVPTGRWIHLEREIDARTFGPFGLSCELQFPSELLNRPGISVRVACIHLADAEAARRVQRPASVEAWLAKRFFQRHDSSTVNSIGRPLVVNAHELHFQFTFPELRSFPACTVSHDNRSLRVFDHQGIPQDDFVYDVTYRSRGSVIIRAAKMNHGLRDGCLSFTGGDGEILLDSEL